LLRASVRTASISPELLRVEGHALQAIVFRFRPSDEPTPSCWRWSPVKKTMMTLLAFGLALDLVV
jgi:hypothetical protein